MEKERDQNQPSYVDRANEAYKNTLRLKKAYKKARRLRTAANVVRGVRAGVATTQTAAATWEIWVPALIIGLIVFLVVITVIIVFIGGQNVKAVTPQDCADIGGTCSSQATCSDVPNSQPDTTVTCSDAAKPTCCLPPVELPANCSTYASDPLAGLKNIFNINVSGGNTTDYTKLLRYLCDAARAPNFTPLLTNGGRVLKVYLNDMSNTRGACSGHAPLDTNTVYFGPWTCGASERSMKHLVLHEFGHVIYYRNDTLTMRYPYRLLTRTDSSCYSAGYLITYPNSGSCASSDVSPLRESFAESIAEYIIPISTSAGYCSRVISNFPVTCDNTYAWFKDNAFLGYTY